MPGMRQLGELCHRNVNIEAAQAVLSGNMTRLYEGYSFSYFSVYLP